MFSLVLDEWTQRAHPKGEKADPGSMRIHRFSSN